jgi:hypothetical protein
VKARIITVSGYGSRLSAASRASAGTTIASDVREANLRLQKTIDGSGPLFRVVIYNE